MTVKYLDGRTVDVVATARAQVETERHYSGYSKANTVEFSYYLAWFTLHKADKESADFESWLDLIEDVDETEPAPVGPTPETPSPTSSSD